MQLGLLVTVHITLALCKATSHSQGVLMGSPPDILPFSFRQCQLRVPNHPARPVSYTGFCVSSLAKEGTLRQAESFSTQ